MYVVILKQFVKMAIDLQVEEDISHMRDAVSFEGCSLDTTSNNDMAPTYTRCLISLIPILLTFKTQ